MDPNTRALIMGASGGAAEKVYVEDVFSTWLYTGNGSTQTITNGIDLAGKGGLVWFKQRNNASGHELVDTARGAGKKLRTDATNGETVNTDLTSFTSSGFSLDYITGGANVNAGTFASWTFRKAAKFFDVVTYTGDGTGGRTLSHALNGTIGAVIVKRTDSTGDWYVAARISSTQYTVGDSAAPLRLNATSGGGSGFDTAPYWSSTTFKLSAFWNESTTVNVNGATYVAYVFAHDAGGFGDSGNDSVSACGSFTTDGSGNATITLGWEPQWLLVKANANATNWRLVDTMRGWRSNATNNAEIGISANSSSPEDGSLATAYQLTSTGFNATSLDSSTPYIYIAIRRGPMKTPTDATKVFDLATYTASTNPEVKSTNLDYVDFFFNRDRASASTLAWDRLRGGKYLRTEVTNAEADTGSNRFDYNKSVNVYYWSTGTQVNWMFRRAPGFFDVVAYTGTDANRMVSHNLGVAPELMIVKQRSGTAPWAVYCSALGNGQFLEMDFSAASTSSALWNNTTPTSSVFTVGTNGRVNVSPQTYVAYLFASLTGISKVGSYTGTGTTLSVDCGFTNGARFVLIKRTDSTGDWYVWDTARGIVSGNDPYLLLNSTAAEVTNTDFIDPLSSGFQISSTAPAAINANGGTFIYLAIA
jgi:hypothetical protein